MSWSTGHFLCASVQSSIFLVHIRTAGAAGKLSIGLWDHWVPGGTEKMRQQVQAWAAKSKVDVTADFITSQGNKLLLTAAAEAQARSGHDVLPFFQRLLVFDGNKATGRD